MKIVFQDHYALTYRYMQVLAIELAGALAQNGVADPEIQRKVADAFLFGVADGWDECYITDLALDRKRMRPAICFISTDSDELVVPDGKDDFHELAALSSVASVFQPNDPDSDLEFIYDNGANGDIPFSKQLRPEK